MHKAHNTKMISGTFIMVSKLKSHRYKRKSTLQLRG